MNFLQKIITILFIFTGILFSSEYSKQAVIIIDKKADHIKIFAAQELQKHLQLILNKNILITNSSDNIDKYKYSFYIGQNPKKISQNLKSEESRYEIIKNKIYLYGDDLIQKKENSPIETSITMRNRTGTLFSVYDFLYNELVVRWIEPGDLGIVYKHQDSLYFTEKQYSWYPKISFRYFRNDIWRWHKLTGKRINMYKYTPKELQPTKKYVEKKESEELVWMRRMKQGINNKPIYGHAFTKYWNKYGKEHQQWFALGKNKKRGLPGSKSKDERMVKLCITNENLQNQISCNWKNYFLKYKDYNIYNACINDLKSYCRCKKCRTLDNDYKKHPSVNFETESKTDRYVYFWNALIKKAKVFNPNANVIAYAYSDYRYPPKREILSDNIILGFVPKFSDLPSKTTLDLLKWQVKGLKHVFLRPNDFNDDIGMPMGHEKFIYDKFRVFKGLNIFGIDYDRNRNTSNWGHDGISYYILAQAVIHPSKTYEDIENEYFSTFGNAKKNIKTFYHYWRFNFEKKRLNYISTYGGTSSRNKMYKHITKFYKLKDFDTTNNILKKALTNTNNTCIKNRIKRLLIINKHSKKIFIALSTKNKENYKKLLKFRIKHKKELNISFPMIFLKEYKYTNFQENNTFIKRVIRYIKFNF